MGSSCEKIRTLIDKRIVTEYHIMIAKVKSLRWVYSLSAWNFQNKADMDMWNFVDAENHSQVVINSCSSSILSIGMWCCKWQHFNYAQRNNKHRRKLWIKDKIAVKHNAFSDRKISMDLSQPINFLSMLSFSLLDL